MSKHTPGPWAVHPSAPMAVHQPEYQCWIPQNKADVQLIAAAPDLLEALRSITDAADEKRVTAKHYEIARTAIAKATGEKE